MIEPTPLPQIDITHPDTIPFCIQAYGRAEYMRGLENAAEVCHSQAVTVKNPAQINVAVDCYAGICDLKKVA